MGKDRLAAFSDGVIAIIITIMVLELKVPHGADWAALSGQAPNFVSYVLSFIYLAIYWNNHHHLLHTVTRVDGRILWADFVAKVGNGKSEAVASMSLSGLLHPLHLAAGPLRQRH